MKNIKSHFEMHIRFRNGIFLLVLVITALILVYYFYPSSVNKGNSFIALTEYQKKIDSLKLVLKKSKEERALRKFNPNFITDYKGYVLGLSVEELQRLHEYRDKGKWINSIADFQKVTKVSDSLLESIAPLFKFPDWVNSKNKKNTNYHSRKNKLPKVSYAEKGDLNAISKQELEEKIGVPDFVAEKLIKYRNDINGFVSDLQLKDINELYDSQRRKILSLYTVKTPRQIQKVNLNTATVKEMMEVPYFDFEMALEIRDFIKEKGKVNAFEELKNIEGFSLEKIDRIALYLTLN